MNETSPTKPFPKHDETRRFLMPIDWTFYQKYFATYEGTNVPLTAPQQRAVEETIAGALGLDSATRAQTWGRASPPGAVAATVVRIAGGVRGGHATLWQNAERLGISTLAVKLFKGGRGARNAVQKVVNFQNARFRRGSPFQSNPRIQRTLGGTISTNGPLGPRALIFLEWIKGHTLEHLHEHVWPYHPLGWLDATDLIQELLEELALPVWSAATKKTGVVWDWRDAQIVLRGQQLALIDSDCLRYLSGSFENRVGQERKAVKGLRAMSRRLLLSSVRGRSKDAVKRLVNDAWERADLGTVPDKGPADGALPDLGRHTAPSTAAVDRAREGIEQFLSVIRSHAP